MSAGMITEEDVEGIRRGRIVDPLVSQVAAFAAAFGVPPSFLLDRNKDTSVLDEEVLEVLADETVGAILRERLGGSANMMKPFPEKPKGMHWKTYERLWWEHHEAEMEQLARMREWLDKFEKKVG